MSKKSPKSRLPVKRRLPLVPPQKEPLLPARPPSPTEAENPYVSQIVTHIQRVCSIAQIPPFTVLNDWTGMLEAALRFYAANARSYVFTGRFIDDPPDVQAIFRQARERYLKAAETYPAAYREMQIAFSQTFTLLIAAAGMELAYYAAQTAVSPDVIGQVYRICLDLGPAWHPYLAPWPVALEAARTAIPDGETMAYEVLIRGHLAYRADHTVDHLQPEPGPVFEQWFEAVLPYCEPLIIGPTLIDPGVLMLAAAARFPAWAVKNGLIRFYPDSGQPYLDRLARINAMLYGLNGYELELLQVVQDIVAHLEQRPDTLRLYAAPVEPPDTPPIAPDDPLDAPDAPPVEPDAPPVEPTAPLDQPFPFATETPSPDDIPSSPSPGRIKPDQKTFVELFRKVRSGGQRAASPRRQATRTIRPPRRSIISPSLVSEGSAREIYKRYADERSFFPMNVNIQRPLTVSVAGGLTGAVVFVRTKVNEVTLNRQVEAALRHIRLGAEMAWQASLAENEQRANMLQPALHALDRATALTLALVDTTEQSRVIQSELGEMEAGVHAGIALLRQSDAVRDKTLKAALLAQAGSAFHAGRAAAARSFFAHSSRAWHDGLLAAGGIALVALVSFLIAREKSECLI